VSSVFVTGGNGFVGQAILKRLSLDAEPRSIRALARNRTNGETVRALGAEPVMGDVLDLASLASGMEGCDIVYHVAGVNAFCLRDPAPMFRTNIDGSVNVIKAAAGTGVSRVVYTSSAASLGEEEGTIGNEDSRHRGWYLSDYERSKHEAELAVLKTAAKLDVDVVVVNPSSVQGPGRTTGSARLFLEYLNGRRRTMVDTVLSIVDVDDCAEGHVLAERAGRSGERYVLNGASVPVAEALALLDDITGLTTKPRFLPSWVASPGGVLVGRVAGFRGRDAPLCSELVRTLLHGHRYDGSRATKVLGLEYRPLSHTLQRTVDWYVEYGFVRRPLPAYS